MLQDAILRRFRDRMISLFPVLGQRREQVEKMIFFGREICLPFAQKTIDFSDRLIVFGFRRDVFHGDYPRHLIVYVVPKEWFLPDLPLDKENPMEFSVRTPLTSLFLRHDLQVCIKHMIIAQFDHVPQIITFEVIA